MCIRDSYYDGYYLWNLADPLQPMLLGYFDTCLEPNTDSYSGAWGTYPFLPSGHVLVSDMQTGLWVLDISIATSTSQATRPAEFRISPTLTTGPVTITDLRPTATTTHVEVLDASGATVMSTSIGGSSFEVDMSSLCDGLYLVQVVSNDAMHTQRVVKTSIR